jgi:hypothetical protein
MRSNPLKTLSFLAAVYIANIAVATAATQPLPPLIKQFNTALFAMTECKLDVTALQAVYTEYKQTKGPALKISPEDFVAGELDAKRDFEQQLQSNKNGLDCAAVSALRDKLLSKISAAADNSPQNSNQQPWTIKSTIPPENMRGIRRFLVKREDGSWTHATQADAKKENVERIVINPLTRTIWLDAKRSTSGEGVYTCWYGLLSAVGQQGNDRNKVGLTVCNSQFTTTTTSTASKVSQGLLVRAYAGPGHLNHGADGLMAAFASMGFISKVPHDRLNTGPSFIPIPLLPQLAMGTFMFTASVNAEGIKAVIEDTGLLNVLEDEIKASPPDRSWAQVDTTYRVVVPHPYEIRYKMNEGNMFNTAQWERSYNQRTYNHSLIP